MMIKKILFILSLIINHIVIVSQDNYIKYTDIQYKNIEGVNQNLLNLDIYRPLTYNGKIPVIIYIHGGYWQVGNKSNVVLKDNFFTDNGYIFVSINYRLSPYPSDTISSTVNRFPIHAEDCADAIKWVYNNITNFDGDVNKICLIGHSAGAHLALLLSTNNTFLQNVGLNSQSIKCVCSLDCALFDIFYELSLIGNNKQLREPFINAFGNDTLIYKNASPIFNIEKNKYIPFIQLIHQGETNQINSNSIFKDSLIINNHFNVNTLNVYPYNHVEINQNIGSTNDSLGMSDSILQFFNNCLLNNITTELNQSEFEYETLYPNPANSKIFINCEKGYKIYTITGQLVLHDNLSINEIDITNLLTGLYLLQANNKIIKFHKI